MVERQHGKNIGWKGGHRGIVSKVFSFADKWTHTWSNSLSLFVLSLSWIASLTSSAREWRSSS